MYEITQDVKGQLRFLEDIDKVERKRHEEQEREILMKAAKSRSKNEDPEQLKLKQMAKEVSITINVLINKNIKKNFSIINWLFV